MTDAQVGFVASTDATNWTAFKNVVNGYSDHGLQMAVYRGQLWGVMTQTVQYPNYLFANRYNGTEWMSTWISVNSGKSSGRTSVTVLDDRLYVLRRGMDGGIYLFYTYDFTNLTQFDRIGGTFTTSEPAPAICAYNGLLYMACAAPDKTIYWCTSDANGGTVSSWKQISSGIATPADLALHVYRNKLYLLHTGLDKKAFYHQTFDNGSWSSTTKVVTNLDSGLACTSWTDDTLAVSYRGQEANVKFRFFDGSSWGDEKFVPNVFMRNNTGIATWAGQLVISYAIKAGTRNISRYQDRLLTMDEKTLNQDEEAEGKEWQCKWDENNKADQKSWTQKVFCL